MWLRSAVQPLGRLSAITGRSNCLRLEVIVHILHGVNWIDSQEDWLSSDQIQYAGGQVSTTQTVSKKFQVVSSSNVNQNSYDVRHSAT